ncbi:MAG: hypothetical protein P8Y47_05565 [Alphaproteobacteria bacterium]
MQRTSFKFFVGVALNIAVIVMGGDLKAAESNCKGLQQEACGTNGTCSWVRGYKTKNGTQVSAFCRRTPGKRSSAKSAALSSKKAKSAASSRVSTPNVSQQTKGGTTASLPVSSSTKTAAPNASKQ